MGRLLALVLAFCAVLPTQAWARVVEVCSERDRCACRRDETSDRPSALVQRPDCCASPCTAEAVPAPAVPTRGHAIVLAPAVHELPASSLAIAGTLGADAPQVRPRGPPKRWFDRVRHRLI